MILLALAFFASAASAVTPPSNFTASASGYNVNLQWSGASGVYMWELKRQAGASGSPTTIAAYSNSYTDGDMANLTTHSYWVRARDISNNWSSWSGPVQATVAVAVSAPQFTHSSAAGFTVSLRWTAASGCWRWELQRRIGAGSFETVATLSETSYADPVGSNHTTYSYRVRQQDLHGTWSPYSAEAGVTVAVSVAAPANLTAAWGQGRVNLAWTSSSGASHYDIQRANSASGPFSSWDTAYSASYQDTNVASGPTYYYRVRAVSSYGVQSAYSGPVSALDPNSVPLSNGLPESPHPYTNGYSNTWTYYGSTSAIALDVTFDARTATEAGYDFIHVTALDGTEAPGSPFSGTQSVQKTLRVNGTAVKIRLQTDYSVTGWGFAVARIAPVFPPPPSPPTPLKPSGTVAGPLLLSWSAVPQATYYQLEWSSNSVTWNAARMAGTAYAVDLPNGSWLWRVRGGNGSGLGLPSGASPITLVAGYSGTLALAAVERDGLRYSVNLQAYRGPPAIVLTVAGLPPGVRWSFSPSALSGSGTTTLELTGLRAVAVPGAYPFTVLAGTVPVEGARGTLTVAGGMAVEDAHAFPNPSYDGRVTIRASIAKAPTALKLRVYDLTGAPVFEQREDAPFSRFVEVSPGVFDYAWTGTNDSGRAVAGEKYLFWLQAQGGAGTSSARGAFTMLRR
ncbi:MAG: hypothetical protein HY553_14595 [Elusimicrobia bacterium]|nr:hypothetical protein [Elusimicrobiota bacterium]